MQNSLEKKVAFYLGCFPPPYGGATIKNVVLYDILSRKLKMFLFDTSILGKNIFSYIKLIFFILMHRNTSGFICIGSISLFKITKLFAKIRRNNLSNISVFILGGIFDKLIKEHNQDIGLYNLYKNIYVESYMLKEELQKMGLENINVFPNCRPFTAKRYCSQKGIDKSIKCVFLSNICKNKGIFNIIEAAKLLDMENISYSVDFYGPIDKEIEETFLDEIANNASLVYKGIVKSSGEDIYKILDKYDLLLFPTFYYEEGMPGIVVEARIAGLPVVASKWKYSMELIRNQIDGIILEDNTKEELQSVIRELYFDRVKLNKLAQNSSALANEYFIENKIQYILDKM